MADALGTRRKTRRLMDLLENKWTISYVPKLRHGSPSSTARQDPVRNLYMEVLQDRQWASSRQQNGICVDVVELEGGIR